MTVDRKRWTLKRIVVAGADAIIKAHDVVEEHPRPSETLEERQARVADLTKWQWDALGLREKLGG